MCCVLGQPKLVVRFLKMVLPEIIHINVLSKNQIELHDLIFEIKVISGTKNNYHIFFPKTDRNGKAKLLKSDFIGQFTDHYEMGLMDYNGTIETANSKVEVCLYDPKWLNENPLLALAWPLLKNEKEKWRNRQEQYDYFISSRNSIFYFNPITFDLNVNYEFVVEI